MKILLLGKDGQVGWELQRALAPLGELTALNRQGDNKLCGDLSNFESLKKSIETLKPDVIVNAAAFTAVDKAETEQQLARDINTVAPGVIAEAAASIGALLIHYSTDYVFDGSGSTPWIEQDTPSPINYYGKTKLEGENLIKASGCQYLIFRTSWVYGLRGNNFIKTMLRLLSEKKLLNVIDDQVGTPTGADLIADITALVLSSIKETRQIKKIYHLAPRGETSWYEYAKLILNYGVSSTCAEDIIIKPIPSKDYPLPAKRPLNSRLSTDQLSTDFSLYLPSWENGVKRVLTFFARENYEGKK